MGTLIAREAPKERFDVTGAVAARDDPGIGKTLRQLGAGDGDTKVSPPSSLAALLAKSDVCISFTSAQAEVSNLSTIVEGGVPYVSGTTGLTPQQRKDANAALAGKVPAVVASNFSVGANLLIAMSAALKALPRSFDVSIVEATTPGRWTPPAARPSA